MSRPVDFMADSLRAADEGDADAIRSLLEQAADWLCAGEIPDARLRLWLVEYLGEHIANLPGKRGRPDKTIEHFNLCVLVERMHLNGMTITAAIAAVTELPDVRCSTDRLTRLHEKYRQAARLQAQYMIDRQGVDHK